jgi:hypothetical protein
MAAIFEVNRFKESLVDDGVVLANTDLGALTGDDERSRMRRASLFARAIAAPLSSPT